MDGLGVFHLPGLTASHYVRREPRLHEPLLSKQTDSRSLGRPADHASAKHHSHILPRSRGTVQDQGYKITGTGRGILATASKQLLRLGFTQLSLPIFEKKLSPSTL